MKQKADPSAKTEEGTHGLHYLCRIKFSLTKSGGSSAIQSLDKYFEKVFLKIVKSGVDPRSLSGSGS